MSGSEDTLSDKEFLEADLKSEAFADTERSQVDRSAPAWGAILTLFILSAVLGAAGGWAATQFLTPKTETINIAPFETKLIDFDKTLKSQQVQLSRLQNELNALQNALPESNASEVDPKESSAAEVLDKATLERIQQDMDNVKDQIVSLQNDVTSQTMDLKPPVGVDEKLNTDVNLLQAPRITAEGLVAFQSELETLEGRIETLEVGLSETRVLAATPVIVKDPIILPPFPREAVFKALTEMPVTEGEGLISRTLKKHISVRNPEQISKATQSLDSIESAIDTGDIETALSRLMELPEAPRAKALEWIEAAKNNTVVTD